MIFHEYDLMPSFASDNHRWHVPLTVYAADKRAAKETAMIHLGVMLLDMGVECRWIRRCHESE